MIQNWPSAGQGGPLLPDNYPHSANFNLSENRFLSDNFFQRYKILDWKFLSFGEFSDKLKFWAPVISYVGKLQLFAFLPQTFSTHDAKIHRHYSFYGTRNFARTFYMAIGSWIRLEHAISLMTFVYRQAVFMTDLIRTDDTVNHYVVPLPEYYAALTLIFWVENWHTSYACHGKRSQRFKFFSALFVIELGAHARRTDRYVREHSTWVRD